MHAFREAAAAAITGEKLPKPTNWPPPLDSLRPSCPPRRSYRKAAVGRMNNNALFERPAGRTPAAAAAAMAAAAGCDSRLR